MITIPFDLELAKKINNGERNGMIVTDGDNYRVEFVYHREESFPILGVIHTDHGIISDWFSNDGYDENNDKVDGVNVYYDQIDEVVYLVKIILEEMEGKDHGESS